MRGIAEYQECGGRVGFRLGHGDDLLVERATAQLEACAHEAAACKTAVEANAFELIVGNCPVDIELVGIVAVAFTPERGSCPVGDGEVVMAHDHF